MKYQTFTDLMFAALLIGLAACGQQSGDGPAPTPTPTVSDSVPAASRVPDLVAPDPTPTATPTPTPVPPTVLEFIPQDITICDAMRAWNPATTTIRAYTGPIGSSDWFEFRADGVWIVTHDGAGGCGSAGACVAGGSSPQQLVRSTIYTVVCTITVTNGQLTGVTP